MDQSKGISLSELSFSNCQLIGGSEAKSCRLRVARFLGPSGGSCAPGSSRIERWQPGGNRSLVARRRNDRLGRFAGLSLRSSVAMASSGLRLEARSVEDTQRSDSETLTASYMLGRPERHCITKGVEQAATALVTSPLRRHAKAQCCSSIFAHDTARQVSSSTFISPSSRPRAKVKQLSFCSASSQATLRRSLSLARTVP